MALVPEKNDANNKRLQNLQAEVGYRRKLRKLEIEFMLPQTWMKSWFI